MKGEELVTVAAKVDKPTAAYLDAIAEAFGWTRSQVVREILTTGAAEAAEVASAGNVKRFREFLARRYRHETGGSKE